MRKQTTESKHILAFGQEQPNTSESAKESAKGKEGKGSQNGTSTTGMYHDSEGIKRSESRTQLEMAQRPLSGFYCQEATEHERSKIDRANQDTLDTHQTFPSRKCSGSSRCDRKDSVNSDIVSLANESFLSDLQPLPSTSTSPTQRGPGAYAIQGCPQCTRHDSTYQVSPHSSLPRTGSDDIVHEAVVCEDWEGEVTSTGADDSGGFNKDTENGYVMGADVVDAKIVTDEANHSENGLCGWMIVLFIVFVAGLVVLLPLLLKYGGSENPDTIDNMAGLPARLLYPPFQDDLPIAMVNSIEDPTHPHSFANTWIWQDPHKESYSRQRQIQRFHLASFYYITGGDNWFRNDDWLSYDVPECEWFSQHQNQSIPHYEDYPICDEDGNLLVLNLASNNLKGSFPMVTNFIDTLRTYDISNNSIRSVTRRILSSDPYILIESYTL